MIYQPFDYVGKGYAGKYLKTYERFQYTFTEKSLRFVDRLQSILVPTDAEEFADVSFWQAGIDWDEYARHARAVVLRISQNIWEDAEWEKNYQSARTRNLLIGGYVFFDGRVTPQQQANTVINAMRGRSLDMELIVDWERSYGGLNEGLPNVVKLMQILEASGIQCKAVGTYTGYYWFVGNSNPTTHAAEYAYLKTHPLWLAWYAAASLVKVPPPWTAWTHWQYGTLAVNWGQPTAEIDMNKFNGTKEQFGQQYGAPTPPSGGTMEKWKVTTDSLKVRSGPGTTFSQVQSLFKDDFIEGVFDAVSSWINISKITRANGNTFSPTAPAQWWCSGLSTYVEKIMPPVVKVTDINIKLAAGSVVTTKYSDGSQEVKVV